MTQRRVFTDWWYRYTTKRIESHKSDAIELLASLPERDQVDLLVELTEPDFEWVIAQMRVVGIE